MKKLLLFLCLVVQTGFAQTLRIDSLKRELGNLQKQPNGYIKDTLRCQTLKAIMRAYADVNIDSSLHYNTSMILVCRKQKLQKELIYAYQYAGYLYQVRGDYRQSIWFYFKALTLAEELKQYTRVARSCSGLAHAYTSLEKYSDANTYCQKGLEVLRKHPDATIQLSILNVLGAVYREQDKLAEALKNNQDMYKLAQQERKQWFESQGLHAIGWVYKEMGDLTKALDNYKKALIVCPKIGSVDLEVSILLHISEVYIQQEKWLRALTFCNLAKQKATGVKNSGIVKEAEEDLYKIYKQTGEPAKALQAHENYVQLKDSLSKAKNQQLNEMLQAEYDNVKKTKEVEQLNQKIQQNKLYAGVVAILLIATLLFWNNRRLQAKNRELVRKNEEIKEALFKGQTIERKRVALELHDNLSSLLSAVNMSVQSINPLNLSESEQSVYQNVKHLIQNAYAEVRNISHNILPAGLEQEGLASTLTALIDKLNQNSPLQFSLTITGLQERMPVEIEFNVYSIVLELINNTIKHAKATAVRISLFRNGSGVDLSVMDDGIGLDQHHPKRGVGLQNIQTRLDSLGGSFNTILSPEKGTWILIKIPIETDRFNGN